VTVLESLAWASVFGASYDRWGQVLTRNQATRQAVREADEAIANLRERIEEKGRLHVFDELEEERLRSSYEESEEE